MCVPVYYVHQSTVYQCTVCTSLQCVPVLFSSLCPDNIFLLPLNGLSVTKAHLDFHISSNTNQYFLYYIFVNVFLPDQTNVLQQEKKLKGKGHNINNTTILTKLGKILITAP